MRFKPANSKYDKRVRTYFEKHEQEYNYDNGEYEGIVCGSVEELGTIIAKHYEHGSGSNRDRYTKKAMAYINEGYIIHSPTADGKKFKFTLVKEIKINNTVFQRREVEPFIKASRTKSAVEAFNKLLDAAESDELKDIDFEKILAKFQRK